MFHIILKISNYSKSFVEETLKVFEQIKSLRDIASQNSDAAEEQQNTTKIIISSIEQMNTALQETSEKITGFVSVISTLTENSSKVSHVLGLSFGCEFIGQSQSKESIR